METKVIKQSFGEIGALRIVVEWRDDFGTSGPVGKTWSNIQLWVGETLVWGELNVVGNTSGFDWSLIDLLDFLSNAWPYLIEEEQHPIPFESHLEEPAHIGQLLGKAKLRFLKLPEAQADREEELLHDFLVVHDLSEALHGAQAPRLLLLRRGHQMLAATATQEWVLPLAATIKTLTQLGDAIAFRIRDLGDERSTSSCKRWQNRDAVPPAKRLQIAVGRDQPSLTAIWPADINSIDAANDRWYELKAAARMIGRRVSDNTLRTILERLQSLKPGKDLQLGTLLDHAKALLLEHESDEPMTQGYFLASMVREHLGIRKGRVDPERILSSWGVSISDIEIPDSGLDAIAAWKSGHATTILVNRLGPRSQHFTGRRSTLAHEMCHLLADTDGALPAVEVLGGSVSHEIEQRANAFAAEFLLPRVEAAEYITGELRFVHLKREREKLLDRCVDHLAHTYQTSHETTAWQVLNSGAAALGDRKMLHKHLRSIYDPYVAIAMHG